jgi:hypothetical protein
VHDLTLAKIGAAHGCSATAVALAWAIRSGGVIAIPESGSPAHVKENAVALSLKLTPQELETLDAAHPVRSVDGLRSLLDRGRRSGRPSIWRLVAPQWLKSATGTSWGSQGKQPAPC